ncbi:MAG: META domain-containing protein [Bacteroidales bacterium]|jgi:heat shock protein HslJ|nr:META domain-containing protein [Bacteroidales bacterium]
MKRNFLLILLAVAVVATAYGRPKKKKSQVPLVSTYWVLVAIEGESIDNLSRNATPTITFDSAKYSGNFGCNQFFGQYFAKEKTISIDFAASTRKMCSNMELETAYSKALRKDLKYYTIDGYELYLKDNKKKTILKFVCGTKESKE